MLQYLVKDLGQIKWLWFDKTNTYLQMDNGIYQVFEKISKKESAEDIISWCVQTFNLSKIEAQDAVNEILKLIENQEDYQKNEKTIATENVILTKKDYYGSKYYSFHSSVFSFHFGDANIENIFHPLFAHLEIASSEKTDKDFFLIFQRGNYLLKVQDKIVGIWPKDEEHLFKGRVFMEFLNYVYSKNEKEWLGVLHASAIGNEENCVLFLGDSGSGKSTASAIAMASGLSLIADDFVPVDINGKVLTFPAAISVKKKALSYLSVGFPELLKAKEYELKFMNKTVRYLSPKTLTNNLPKAIKALIFIKYTKEVEFSIEKLDINLAFQYLVVDAWLSPEEENARFFMDWISQLPAYRLYYSNNEKMLESVNNILNDES